jgi:hypothetical protein
MGDLYFKDAYHQYQISGHGGNFHSFDLIYTKADGTFGQKKGCTKRVNVVSEGKSDLSSIKTENREAGKWYLSNPENPKFEIHACGIICFNGQFIDHRF